MNYVPLSPSAPLSGLSHRGLIYYSAFDIFLSYGFAFVNTWAKESMSRSIADVSVLLLISGTVFTRRESGERSYMG